MIAHSQRKDKVLFFVFLRITLFFMVAFKGASALRTNEQKNVKVVFFFKSTERVTHFCLPVQRLVLAVTTIIRLIALSN